MRNLKSMLILLLILLTFSGISGCGKPRSKKAPDRITGTVSVVKDPIYNYWAKGSFKHPRAISKPTTVFRRGLPKMTALPDQLVVAFASSVSAKEAQQLLEGYSLQILHYLEQLNAYKVKLTEAADRVAIINELKRLPQVKYVAENRNIIAKMVLPTDPGYDNNSQWDLSQIDLPAAWDLTTGSNTVKVAIVDLGFFEHEDIKWNVGEGRDFYAGLGLPFEYDTELLTEGGDHATHIAGTIGAITNNGKGIAGVNWNVDLIPVRIGSAAGDFTNEADTAAALIYAAEHANIINMS